MVKKKGSRLGTPGPDGGRVVISLKQIRVPTAEAIERIHLCWTECWANTPSTDLDGRTPWHAALTEAGRRDVEEIVAARDGEAETYLAQLASLGSPGRRFDEAYQKSGGVLNVMNESVTEADDDLWQRLVAEHIEGVAFPSDEARAHALQEISQLWNNTPSELFSNLTPAQVWAGGGPKEAEVLDLLVDDLASERGDKKFSCRGDLIRDGLFFLRRWQVVPLEEFEEKTPVAVILEERDAILRSKLAALRGADGR